MVRQSLELLEQAAAIQPLALLPLLVVVMEQLLILLEQMEDLGAVLVEVRQQIVVVTHQALLQAKEIMVVLAILMAGKAVAVAVLLVLVQMRHYREARVEPEQMAGLHRHLLFLAPRFITLGAAEAAMVD